VGIIALDIKTLATMNLLIQIVLMMVLFLAVFRARKGDVNKHCNILKIAVLLQLAAIFIFMLPSFPGYKASNASMIDLVKILHHLLDRYWSDFGYMWILYIPDLSGGREISDPLWRSHLPSGYWLSLLSVYLHNDLLLVLDTLHG